MTFPLMLAALALQTTPVLPMPKGTALPPPGSEEAAVIAPIDRLFRAMLNRDSASILAEVRPEGVLTTFADAADGTQTITQQSWAQFAARFATGSQRMDERLFSPAIEIDGNMAMVWSPYTFHIDGKLSHCGIDHFSLLREGGKWRIQNLSWTRRTTDCPAD